MRRTAFRAVFSGAIAAVMLGLAAASASADSGTPVTCGNVITVPGRYFLASDCFGPGITITASDVDLKLDGHMMGGTCNFFGIDARSVARLHVQGPGTIRNYDAGVFFGPVDDSHVQQVTVTNNCSYGMWVSGSRNQFNDNVATHNSGSGFQHDSGADNHYVNNTADYNINGFELNPGATVNHIDGNEASDNVNSGIYALGGATANKIHGNTALGNGVFDLEDDNPNCDSNVWEGNTFLTTNQPQCVS